MHALVPARLRKLDEKFILVKHPIVRPKYDGNTIDQNFKALKEYQHQLALQYQLDEVKRDTKLSENPYEDSESETVATQRGHQKKASVSSSRSMQQKRGSHYSSRERGSRSRSEFVKEKESSQEDNDAEKIGETKCRMSRVKMAKSSSDSLISKENVQRKRRFRNSVDVLKAKTPSESYPVIMQNRKF